MDPLTLLLIIVAGIALISGAIILTPLGIIVLAFAIYSWNALYPLLLRIGRWSAQRQNFVPVLVPAIIIDIVIFLFGLALFGLFGFSGSSLLLFIWLFFMWLFVTGLAALPVALAIVVWVVRGIHWLWPRYRDRFWSVIPWGSSKAAKDTIGNSIPAKQKRQQVGGLDPDKQPKEGITDSPEKFEAGGTTFGEYVNKLISRVGGLLHLR